MKSQDFNFQPGMMVSHFRLEKLLGKGGMGAVYLAEDVVLSRDVAIKFMSREMLQVLGTPEMKKQIEQRFIREAKSVAGMNHPNIALVHEADFSNSNWYIVMEFIEGKPLDEILKANGPFVEKQALDLMEQTVKGLRYAWRKSKIVHRDIKPQNLMLTEDNVIKIVDLGLAKPTQEEDGLDLTEVGAPVGTPFYMSPEQAVAGIIDYRADMFALGATVYELLTGNKAYPGKSTVMIHNKKVKREYLPLDQQYFDKNLSLIVHRLLEPDANDRYGDYDELLVDIERVKSGKDILRKSLMDTIDEMAETLDESAYAESDPMAETLDESAYSGSDPMAETMDDESAYSGSDPMAETMDDESAYSGSDPMAETMDDESAYSGSDPMAETLDESACTGSDPMAETMDDESKISQEKPLEEKDEPQEIDPPKDEFRKLDKSVSGLDESAVHSQFEGSQIGEPPKDSALRLVLLVAILVVSLLIYFNNKDNSDIEPTVEWPSLKWDKLMLANKQWYHSYSDTNLLKLDKIAQNDPELQNFITRLKTPELIYFNNVISRNKDNADFLNSPVSVVSELSSKENLTNLNRALVQIGDIQVAFKSLKIHRDLTEINNRLTAYVPELKVPLITSHAESLIKAHAHLNVAEEWLVIFSRNASTIESIQTLKDWEKDDKEKVVENYFSFMRSLNVYEASTDLDTHSVKLTNLLISLKNREPEVVVPKITEFTEVLKEFRTQFINYQGNRTRAYHKGLTEKIKEIEPLSFRGTEKEQKEFKSIIQDFKSLPVIEKQLSVDYEILENGSETRHPSFKITSNFDCYIFYLSKSKVEEDTLFKSSGDTNTARSLLETKKVSKRLSSETWIVAFTYKEDADKFIKLIPSEVNPKFSLKELESQLKTLNPKTFVKKVITNK